VNRYLFVYGTLRAGSGHPWAQQLARHARYLGPASMRGRMYDLGRYPGAVTSCTAGERVTGDLYRLNSATLLRELDRYEGCTGRVCEQEYRRAAVCVMQTDTGLPVRAWAYLHRRPVSLQRRIANGDWLMPRFNSRPAA
jgi:gamma-glutamylcyclotransferase (GGCT)/AIG2-like uncharacterized protein YtfP